MNLSFKKFFDEYFELSLIFCYLVFTIIACKLLTEIKGLAISFASLSVGLILLKRKIPFSPKIHFWIPVIIFLLLISIQFVLFDSYFYSEFFASLSWLICPLLIYFSRTKGFKFFFILAFLWFINTALSFYQFSLGAMVVGLPGNWNWNASLILGLSPVIIYLVHFVSKNFKYKGDPRYFYFLIVCIVLLFIYKTGSRGATVSLILGGLIYFYLYFSKNTKYKKYFYNFAIFAIAAIFAIVYLFSDYFLSIVERDTRIPMWIGALKLIRDNPIIGVGDSGYLSAYTEYRGAAYFLRSHYFAHITEHPHNHILYILGAFGILGGSAILFLSFYPIYLGLRRFQNLSPQSKTVLFSCIFFFTCSLFDMTYYHWHNYFAISILLGLSWRIAFIPSVKTESKASSVFYLSRALTAVVLLIFFVKSQMITLEVNRYHNAGQILGEKYETQSISLHLFDKACALNPNTSYSLLGAGLISIQDFKDPIMAEHYFSLMQKTPNPSISRSNLRMADAKFAIGKKREALYFLNKDLQNYPISIETLYKKLKLEEMLGMIETAKETSLMIADALKLKELDWEDLPIVAKNHYFDNKFEEYKFLKKRLAEEKKLENKE